MICCLVFALLMAPTTALRRASWLVTGRGLEPSSGFAPVAVRPAPGVAVLALPMTRPPVAPSRRALMLRSSALGVGVYVVAIAVLTDAGALGDRASTGSWLLRTALLAAVAITLSRTAAARPGEGRVVGRQFAGCALVGLGLTWFELGALDMHVFSLFDVAGGSLTWDLVFHGAGLTAAAAGALLLQTGARPARPARVATGAAVLAPAQKG